MSPLRQERRHAWIQPILAIEAALILRPRRRKPVTLGASQNWECKFMKLQGLSFVAAIAAVSLTVGCATTGKTATAPGNSMRGMADAVIHISGLS